MQCDVAAKIGFWNQTNFTQIQTVVLCNLEQFSITPNQNVHVSKIGINQNQVYKMFSTYTKSQHIKTIYSFVCRLYP